MSPTEPSPSPKPHCLLMGVINATPNSFSDGGDFLDVEAAVQQALTLEAEGADILDIGGESTHPKALPITVEEEMARVLPVFQALSGKINTPLSIDTYRAETAAAALAAGAFMVNDVWGLQRDPAMAEVVARHNAFICIMHNKTPVDETCDIIDDILHFFEKSLEIARTAGIAREMIILDPGIGFGKTFEQSQRCIRDLDAFHRFDRPLLVGASRKGFIGALTGETDPKQRLAGTLGAHLAARQKGAEILRVHDIRAHRQALAVFDAVNRPPDGEAQA